MIFFDFVMFLTILTANFAPAAHHEKHKNGIKVSFKRLAESQMDLKSQLWLHFTRLQSTKCFARLGLPSLAGLASRPGLPGWHLAGLAVWARPSCLSGY